MENLRKPLALANGKMAMTIAESLGFVQGFCPAVGDLKAGRKSRDPVTFAQIVRRSG